MNLRLFIAASLLTLSLASCSKRQDPHPAVNISLAQAESSFGPLITTGNHPTPDQNGTGERVGFFRDAEGTVWGLPLLRREDGTVAVCAPSALRNAAVTDTVPAGATIVGTTNEPTGWRGGTGKLELVLRDGGSVRWQPVAGSRLKEGTVCWASEPPGPRQQLEYYRLQPAGNRQP